MSKELLCYDYDLYDQEYVSIVGRDSYTGIEYSDVKMKSKSIRIYGTKKQIEEAEKNYKIDECFSFKVEPKGSYWYNIYNNPEEYNEKVKNKLLEYKELYKRNNNKVLIFRVE